MATAGILSLDQVAGQPVGGKARGLGALLAAGFPVPEGFVVLPEATPEEIVSAYRQLGSFPVAVRSSADAEDSDRSSYAGQFETFLNVIGEESLLRAVAACHVSASSDRVTSYRVADAAVQAPRMCIIVQRMLEPEYAGVAFVTPEGELLVEGVPGLGDQLVSGRVNPASLPEALRRRVEHLAREVVERLDRPLDLEWASAQERLWLLQARPLTAPFSTTLPARFRLWTAANVQEAVPRPLTPLSEEVFLTSLERIFRASFASLGLPEPDGPFTRVVKGRVYMSYSALASALSAMPGFRIENLFRLYGDHPALAPLIEYRPGPKRLFLRRLPMTIGRFIGWGLFAPGRIHRCLTAARRYDGQVRAAIVTGASDAALASLRQAGEAASLPAVEAMFITGGRAMGYLNAMLTLAARVAPWAPSAEVAAMAVAGEMESLEPSKHLIRIAGWIRAHSDCPDDDPELQRRLATFMEACGFRCEHETEVAEPRWHERPDEVLLLARHLAMVPPQPTRRPDVVAAGHHLVHAPVWLWLVLRVLARPARVWQARREAARAILMRWVNSLRRLLLEIGQRIHRRGTIEDPGDVFYLRQAEIEALLAGQDLEVKPLISTRRVRHHQLLASAPSSRLLAELPDGRLSPYEPSLEAGEMFSGFGASPGRVAGQARVLTEIGQAHALEPGEVLVTRTTDIAWTPLFHVAAAIVTEIGAPTSHAVIVARELGLPAVVNVSRATQAIRTGDRLLVDGWTGTVRRLRDSPLES